MSQQGTKELEAGHAISELRGLGPDLQAVRLASDVRGVAVASGLDGHLYLTGLHGQGCGNPSGRSRRQVTGDLLP
jgi:hypothetical protein